MGQRGRTFHCVLSGCDVAVHGVHPALLHPHFDHLQTAADARQQVVEVVGNPAGQLTYRFHLLSLTKLLLDALTLNRFVAKTLVGREEIFRSLGYLRREDPRCLVKDPCVLRARSRQLDIGPDARPQLSRAERLNEIIVRPPLQAFDLGFVPGARRQDDHGHVA